MERRLYDKDKDVCKKSHVPVDLKETPRADGASSFTAFCEVRNVDQLSAILKMASEKVLEEQKAMTKELVLVNDSNEPIMSQSFVKDSDIDYQKLAEIGDKAISFEIRDSIGTKLTGDTITPGDDIKAKVKEEAAKHNPKNKKSLMETIKDKKEQSVKKDKNRQREKTKQKSKSQNQSR